MLPARKMMVCPDDMIHNSSLLDSVATFVNPMTQFFSLPDFTSEEVHLPTWVFPKRASSNNCEDSKEFEDNAILSNQSHATHVMDFFAPLTSRCMLPKSPSRVRCM